MERKKEDRSLLMFILLTAVTCGIYGIYFYWYLIKDLNTVCRIKEDNDENNSPNYIVLALLTFFTCGIYNYYWMYKQGNRIQRVGKEYGIQIDENGTSYLMWVLFGALLCGIGPFVYYYLLFKNINQLCHCYNQEYVDGVVNNYDGNNYDGNNYGGNGYASNQGAGNNQPQANGNKGLPGGYQEEGSTQGVTIGMRQGALACTRGSMAGAEIPVFDGEVIVIGRDGNNCNLVLSDKDISRRHCVVQFGAPENCYYVTDYSSLGTKVNGQPMEKNKMTKCDRGSKIVLGSGYNEFLLK